MMRKPSRKPGGFFCCVPRWKMCQKVLSAKRDIEKADESGCFAGEAFRKVLHTDRETGPDRPEPELNNIKERSAADAVWKERKEKETGSEDAGDKDPGRKNAERLREKEESGFQSKFAGDVGSLTEPKQEREIASPKEATLEAPGNRRKTRTKAKNTKLDKAKKAKIKAMRIPKSSQDTLPYLKVFRNGIFMSEDDVYTKTYTLTDANFKTATQDHQDEMYFAYGDLLNYFQPDVRPQFTIFNTKLDKEVFRENTLFEDQNDGADDLRHAMNAVLEEKINEGQNNIVQKKFITVGVAAENIQVAANVFSRVDTEMVPKIQQINGDNNTEALNLVDRLTLLYNIYNQSATMPFYKKWIWAAR